MSEIGKYLKELRGSRSLREVEKLSGVSHTYLSSLEKGRDPRTGKERSPTPETLLKLAKTYEPLNYEPLYTELMYLAGHIEVPPAAVDFGGGEELKLIEYYFSDLKTNCVEELRMLENHYRLVFGEDFTISIASLKKLLWAKTFTQGAAQLFNELLVLIEKMKKNKNPGLELTEILGNQNKVLYNDHPLTDSDQERILSMLNALFPEYE